MQRIHCRGVAGKSMSRTFLLTRQIKSLRRPEVVRGLEIEPAFRGRSAATP